MTSLSVERFTFDVPQRSREEAERLARLVAERLRIALPYVDELTNIDRMEVTVRDQTNADVDRLADEIVENIVREIERLA